VRKLPNGNTINAEAETINNITAGLSVSAYNGLYLKGTVCKPLEASLVPPAVVIPAPIAYLNVVAAKTPVVGFER